MRNNITLALATSAISASLAIPQSALGLALNPTGGCPGQDEPVRDDANETYDRLATLDFFTSGAVAAAHNNFNASGTDFTWTEVNGGADADWEPFFNANMNLAGQASVATTAGCELVGDFAQMNTNHPWVNQDDKTCTAIHEAGHLTGLAHGNTLATSIMPGGVHNTRCHVASPAIFLRSQDVADINFKY